MKRALQIIICLCCIGVVVYFVENYVHREKHVSPPVVKKELEKPELKGWFGRLFCLLPIIDWTIYVWL